MYIIQFHLNPSHIMELVMNRFAFSDLVMREGVSCGFGSVSSRERFWNMLLVSKRWQSVMEKI